MNHWQQTVVPHRLETTEHPLHRAEEFFVPDGKEYDIK